MLESGAMELIRQIAEFVSTGLGGLAATLAPYGFIGLVGLYLLWLVIGYLRVSQVGIEAEAATLPALQLPRSQDGAIEAPRGVAYCPNDGLRYPAGALPSLSGSTQPGDRRTYRRLGEVLR